MAAKPTTSPALESKDPNQAYWNQYVKNPAHLGKLLGIKGPDLEKYKRETGWVDGVSTGYDPSLSSSSSSSESDSKKKGKK